MHFQVIFNGIWKGFQLVLEGISIDFVWIPMLFWMECNAFWMDFQCMFNGFPIVLSSRRDVV